ncbi:glutamate-1-semialdehyde 2,1-aminomutase [Ferrimicrobium sp.]|uniref:Glutamate-1-semialdehyde 2,1-aminomutase n=1 Tax=Ferrimicrobium acidiphilum TaxID=121039 RepID=A0ABV3Y596_9ACTN|nr:glutamate-1-semialdehyde 2,1-aminomutase [Ferrimicrobium sp.]
MALIDEEHITNEDAFQRACASLVGGVNSPVRSFAAVGGVPFFVAGGHGSYLTDVEGRRYLDYIQSYGAIIHGHGNPVVLSALTEAARQGTTFGAPTLGEVELAEMIQQKVSGVDLVRLTSSGTEATMTALRLARGVTNRSKIVKFEGCYHGHSDALLAASGSGVASLGLPASVGVAPNAVADTIVVPYNELPPIDETVAAVIVEPVAANMGLVPAQSGFLQELRSLTEQSGALLIFDEVITGFRVAEGGASALYGVTPDLWCFGKIIGGGLPVGAVAGPHHLMNHLAPTGSVYQAGTLSGNPLATAAGSAALRLLNTASYRMLTGRAEQLAFGLTKVIEEADLAVQVQRVESLLGIFFADEPVTNYRQAVASVERGIYPYFFHAMLKRGIALAPGPYEVLFPGLAHSVDDVDKTIDVASAAAAEARERWRRAG